MILSVGNAKGGVGKATLALDIARALAGRKVWLGDGCARPPEAAIC